MFNWLLKIIGLDTTKELDKLNKELEAKNRQYNAITNSLLEAIITSDINGIILECNKSVYTIFGWVPQELVGQSVEVVIPAEYRSAHRLGMEKYRQTRQGDIFGKIMETEGLHKNGNLVPINLSVSPVVFESVVLFSAVIRDVTHQRANAKQVSILIETLKTRVKALEAFQFSVAHDLHAPLRALHGFSEILLEDHADNLNSAGKDCVVRITSAVKRMQHLIKDMIRLSKVTQSTQIKRTEVNLSQLAHDSFVDLQRLDAGRKIEIIIEPNMKANVDEDFFRILLDNLLSNAIKFTGKKPVAKIEFGRNCSNGKCTYYIKDNGAGFDMAKSDKLFQPFSRLHTKQEFEGNGVGLSIVKQVINLHGGSVWAEGEVNKGATFYFMLEDNLYATQN